MSSSHFTQNGDLLWNDPRLQKWRMEVTGVENDDTPQRDITVTKHGSGGEEVTRYIGSWLRLSPIGGGGSSVVYSEKHSFTSHMRAVKQLTKSNDGWAKREIEQMLWVKAFPRLFVNFQCWYQCYGCIYIAMDYLPLGDIGNYIARFGAFEERAARPVAEQVLQGIFVIHENGYMHRDIKPENILIVSTSPMSIKLADFGAAKEHGVGPHTLITTKGWTAPEQSSGNGDHMMDMWNVGLLVFFFLTSLKPFDEGDCAGDDPAIIEKFLYPFWPRHSFRHYQQSPTMRVPGDYIVARGISNSANGFLNSLLVVLPNERLTAHQALKHPWIMETSPLHSALQYGDLPLARLLSRHEPSDDGAWRGPYTTEIWQIILRAGAANGHPTLVDRALRNIAPPRIFNYFLPERREWRMPPALLGAAKNGDARIVATLFERLQPVEKSQTILLNALKAALNGRHHEVVDFLWPKITDRNRGWDRQLILDIASFSTAPFLRNAIAAWSRLHAPNNVGLLAINSSTNGPTTFAHHYRSMLESVAGRGNNCNLEILLGAHPAPGSEPGRELICAITAGHSAIVKLVLAHHRGCFDGSHPLFVKGLSDASFHGHLDIVKSLVEWGVVPSKEDIQDSATRHHTAVCRYLVEHLGFAGQVVIPPDAIPHCGLPFLVWLCSNPLDPSYPGDLKAHVLEAARIGDQDMVVWLLAKAHGTPLETGSIAAAFFGASSEGRVTLVALLCEQYREANTDGAFVRAACNGHIEVLELLLAKELRLPRKIMSAALASAIKAKRLGVVLRLLCAGACVGPTKELVYPDDAIGGLMRNLGRGQLLVGVD